MTDAKLELELARWTPLRVQRLTAPNPSPGTFRGTNTYLVHGVDGVTVIDPGPDDSDHLAAILRVSRDLLVRIVLTHGHPDHCLLAPALARAAGVPILGLAPSLAPFELDEVLNDGTVVGGLTAIHTPGHSPDHLCIALSGGVLFTGDIVMSWSSTVVSPPNGRMAEYMASLERLLQRDDNVYLPGHGDPVELPRERTARLLQRRRTREAEIEAAIGQPATLDELLARFYAHVPADLQGAARRTLHAHLLKLMDEERARAIAGDLWIRA